jgi:hypothetical protein
MKFSLASLRNNNAPPKRDQPGMDRLGSGQQRSEKDLPQARDELKVGTILAITVPFACALASIAWAIASYLMVRAKQQAQVELARLEIEAKKQVSSN